MLLDDIEKLHDSFLKQYPDERISLSAFRLLRPQECISVGAKGTHNVCVCKIHGNFKLKLNGLKQEFARKNLDFSTSSHEYFVLNLHRTAIWEIVVTVPVPKTVQILIRLFDENF